MEYFQRPPGRQILTTLRDAGRASRLRLVTWIACALLFAGCSRQPANADRLFAEAEAAYIEGRFADAERLFGQCAAMEGCPAPSPHAARLWQGCSLLEIGHLPEAQTAFAEVLSKTRNRREQARAHRGLARAAFLAGRFTDAERAYRTLGRDYPNETDDAELLAARIECLTQAGLFAQAASLIRDLHAEFPDNPYTMRYPPPQGGAYYAVIAGTFADERDARALYTRLVAAAIDASIVKTTTEGKTVHAVQTGLFSTRKAAETRLREMKRKGFDGEIR